MKQDKMHDIPRAFPDSERKVKSQTKEERIKSLEQLLNVMLEFKDIDKKQYEEIYVKELEKIEEEFSTK